MRFLLALVAAVVVRLLCATWRVRIRGSIPDPTVQPAIFCFWHGRQAGLFAYPRQRTTAVLVSLSRDGDLQSRILRLLGFRVTRGSSSRGGSAGLKALIGVVNRGADAAFAVDGPKGPIHRVKSGAVYVALKTGGSLVPITTRCSRAWIFSRAWDRYELPKPFARVELICGAPIPSLDGDPEVLRSRLERELSALDVPR